jgi:hypothetical protein
MATRETNYASRQMLNSKLAGCGKSRFIVVSLPFIDWGASLPIDLT